MKLKLKKTLETLIYRALAKLPRSWVERLIGKPDDEIQKLVERTDFLVSKIKRGQEISVWEKNELRDALKFSQALIQKHKEAK